MKFPSQLEASTTDEEIEEMVDAYEAVLDKANLRLDRPKTVEDMRSRRDRIRASNPGTPEVPYVHQQEGS